MTVVTLSAKAANDCDDIVDYSTETFGPDVTQGYVASLNDALARLADFPQLGFVVSELNAQIRCLPCRQHRIFYRSEGDMLIVARILHHAMDPRKWLD